MMTHGSWAWSWLTCSLREDNANQTIRCLRAVFYITAVDRQAYKMRNDSPADFAWRSRRLANRVTLRLSNETKKLCSTSVCYHKAGCSIAVCLRAILWAAHRVPAVLCHCCCCWCCFWCRCYPALRRPYPMLWHADSRLIRTAPGRFTRLQSQLRFIQLINDSTIACHRYVQCSFIYYNVVYFTQVQQHQIESTYT